MPIIDHVGPEAELAVIVGPEAETVEIYFYKDGDDTRPTFIAMSGSIGDQQNIEWLVGAAAKKLGIAYRVEQV